MAFTQAHRGHIVPTEFIGIKLSTLLWGFVGGATAALFGPASWTHRVMITAVGTITSSVFGPLWVHIVHQYALRYVHVSVEEVMPPVIFLCGLTGMWLCAAALETAKRFRQDAPDVLSRYFNKKGR